MGGRGARARAGRAWRSVPSLRQCASISSSSTPCSPASTSASIRGLHAWPCHRVDHRASARARAADKVARTDLEESDNFGERVVVRDARRVRKHLAAERNLLRDRAEVLAQLRELVLRRGTAPRRGRGGRAAARTAGRRLHPRGRRCEDGRHRVVDGREVGALALQLRVTGSRQQSARARIVNRERAAPRARARQRRRRPTCRRKGAAPRALNGTRYPTAG